MLGNILLLSILNLFLTICVAELRLITSRMEYIALCASFFLKNELISERKSVTLCKGIGLSNVLICNYKITHFLRYAEIPVPLLYPKKKVIY